MTADSMPNTVHTTTPSRGDSSAKGTSAIVTHGGYRYTALNRFVPAPTDTWVARQVAGSYGSKPNRNARGPAQIVAKSSMPSIATRKFQKKIRRPTKPTASPTKYATSVRRTVTAAEYRRGCTEHRASAS